MTIEVYDKSKYHRESSEFREDLPDTQAGVHIGFFLRWIIEKGFLDPAWQQDFAQDLEDFDRRKVSPSELLEIVGGALVSDMLNADGRRFADAYYYDYQGDYDRLFRRPGHSIFETEDNEENYARARALLDAALKQQTSASR